MQKIRWVVGVVCIFLFPFVGAAVDSSITGPQALLPEGVYAFSTVVEGRQVAHEFSLYNRGDADLLILDIKSG